MTNADALAAIDGWQARTGLARRDVAAFVEAWNRAGQPVPLETFLGWTPSTVTIPSQPSVIDVNQGEHARAS